MPSLTLLPATYCLAKLSSAARLPTYIERSPSFYNLSQSDGELCLLCEQGAIPPGDSNVLVVTTYELAISG